MTNIENYETLITSVGKEQAKAIANYVEGIKKPADDVATKDFVGKAIADAKNTLLFAMFAFWVGTVGIGIVLYFVKS